MNHRHLEWENFKNKIEFQFVFHNQTTEDSNEQKQTAHWHISNSGRSQDYDIR